MTLKIGALSLAVLAIVSCGNKIKNDNSIVVGGDKDNHGCIGSAGYTWSNLKNKCIRTWEQGEKLIDVDPKSTSAAYIIFSDDKSKAELFAPNKKSSMILIREGDQFKGGDYSYDFKSNLLLINGTTKYTLESSNIVGGDKDNHGCISSAGYTWSNLKSKCIRTWEQGEKLNNINKQSTSTAFVVYNDDKSKLELFLPDTESSVILNKEGIVFKSSDISFDSKTNILSINGKEMYKRE